MEASSCALSSRLDSQSSRWASVQLPGSADTGGGSYWAGAAMGAAARMAAAPPASSARVRIFIEVSLRSSPLEEVRTRERPIRMPPIAAPLSSEPPRLRALDLDDVKFGAGVVAVGDLQAPARQSKGRESRADRTEVATRQVAVIVHLRARPRTDIVG